MIRHPSLDELRHPDVQVAIMNARVIALIAQDETRWPLAGDNLFVGLDLSADNLRPGTRLSVGSVLLEITEVPNKDCAVGDTIAKP